MSTNTRYSSGLFAPTPAPGYPGENFFGSVPSSPNTAAPGRSSGPVGGAAAAVNGVLPGGLAAHHALAIFVVVVGGFAIYWWARKE